MIAASNLFQYNFIYVSKVPLSISMIYNRIEFLKRLTKKKELPFDTQESVVESLVATPRLRNLSPILRPRLT
jgi:putative heme iron utilization protein